MSFPLFKSYAHYELCINTIPIPKAAGCGGDSKPAEERGRNFEITKTLLRKKELAKLTAQRQQKVAERDRILALFRRGRIDEQVLDQQLDLIQNETATLQEQIDSASRALSIPDRAAQLESAAKLLQDLQQALHEQSISPELQRRMIDILVESIEARTVERWGVPSSEIVVRYRFSQPHAGATLLWSRTHRLDSRNAGPEELHTLGDHLRRRRLTLKLPQEQAAKQLGVGRASLRHWEQDRQKPGAGSMSGHRKIPGLQSSTRSDRGLNSPIKLAQPRIFCRKKSQLHRSKFDAAGH